MPSSSIQPFGHNRHGPKIGGVCRILGEGELGPRLAHCDLNRGLPTCQVPSSSIQPFGHNRHGPKLGAPPPFLRTGIWVPISHSVACAEAYLHTKWHIYQYSHLDTTNMDLKLGAVPLWEKGSWSPYNTMWARPRPACLPCFVLIHPTV